MPSAKTSAALAGLIDSDDDASHILISKRDTYRDGFNEMAPGRTTVAQQAAPRGRGRPPANGATRKALTEKPTNVQARVLIGKGIKRPAVDDIPSDDVDADGQGDGFEELAKPKPRGRPRVIKAAKLDHQTDDDEDMAELVAQPAQKRGRKPKAQSVISVRRDEIQETQEASPEIPETQQVNAMDLSDVEDAQDEESPTLNRRVFSSTQRPQSQRHFGETRRPLVGGSDAELSDPALRRRIGELNRKYESMELKYRDLRELGIKEAERNYDKLKKQSEEKANTTSQLIVTLKAQLAAQTELAKEGQKLKQRLEASESRARELESKVASMTTSLSDSKTEIKTLSTKLAASRAAEAANAKVPGSAIKGSTASKSAGAESAVQAAQLKEDLYADLTGLIVRGVKREQDEDVYDCIQTGRNGTLHFKLAVGAEGASENFDDAQFLYMPQLDPSRDRALVELLPDYLVEEITFPRPHAAKFYSRVMRSLTERLE